MSWALLAAILAAEPELEPSPELEPKYGLAIWAQPLGLIPLAFTTSSFRLVYASIGFTAAIGPTEIAAEITGWEFYEQWPTPDHETFRRQAGVIAIGPVFHTGSEQFCGFFIQPKIIAEYGTGSYQDEFPLRQWTFGSVQIGATAGWQYRWKRLYLALSLGASVGFGTQGGRANGPIFGGGPPPPGGSGFQWGIDANHLRIGIAL